MSDLISRQAAIDGLTCAQYVIFDAADALEAADKRINELTTKCNQLQAEVDNYEKRIAELKEQLPKDGEWIQMNGHRYCNICGHKDSPILTNYLQDWKRRCPYCGAKMKGERR